MDWHYNKKKNVINKHFSCSHVGFSQIVYEGILIETNSSHENDCIATL